MSVWNMVYTVALTMALSGITVTVLCCFWPMVAPGPVTRAPLARIRHRPAPSATPAAWTCALPGPPLGLEHAHTAMRYHRLHDCPRKRAAFATLVAYGCVVPDRTRRPYRHLDLP